MKTNLKQFNQKETLLVITSFPNPANGKFGKRDLNAVGWHSEHILPFLATRRKVLVCAEATGTQDTFAPSKNILVKRLWEKGNIFSLFKLTKFILDQENIENILVQFEFNVLGGTLVNIVFVAMLYLLALRGKKITFEMHQVLTDIGQLSRHINVTNPILQFIYNMGLKIFYIVVGIVANQVVVFEEEMKTRLKSFVAADKIKVLCLPVKKEKTIGRQKARRILGINQKEFVVLQFGFINGYKGIDFMIAALRGFKNKGLRYLIAGGQNPYLKNRPFYQRLYNSIVREAKKHDHITYTDFVPDEKIHLYFSAADLTVLPYTAFMSASGPLSHALSYGSPVIISEKLSDYAKSADVISALGKAGLKKEDIIFNLKAESVVNIIKKARRNRTFYKKLVTFSKTLADMRNIQNATKNLDSMVFSSNPSRSNLDVNSKKLSLKAALKTA